MEWALLVATVGAAVVTLVGWLGLVGKLPRNGWAGIRTPYTMSSNERWNATHRAGGAVMLLGSIAALAAGLAFLPFALAGKLADALTASIVIAVAVLLFLSAIAGWLYGTARAKAQGP